MVSSWLCTRHSSQLALDLEWQSPTFIIPGTNNGRHFEAVRGILRKSWWWHGRTSLSSEGGSSGSPQGSQRVLTCNKGKGKPNIHDYWNKNHPSQDLILTEINNKFATKKKRKEKKRSRQTQESRKHQQQERQLLERKELHLHIVDSRAQDCLLKLTVGQAGACHFHSCTESLSHSLPLTLSKT